ncbi:TonB-dependent receptor [Pseudomaricurvus alkylphenolicus]|uniref:TonB-dependent receptor n=1 Tax=Pseudomaricurvus alkylphenolicus TaxID=1306991 RepID=UPI0014223C91|nr:TonB-dependent receptor [Pseudomaricurvus alkylphenolicus]NIB41771.1 TonB-dependent receptor [Pseudomaricurvus alkylphenolicus]
MKKPTPIHSKLSLAISGVLTAGLLGSAPVIHAEKAFVMEEIVVSARRRDESQQDVPISMTSYSGDALSKSGAPDIVQVAESVPNTTLKVSRGTNTTITAFIRGVGQQDPVAGFEAGVGIYIDDVYLNRPQGAVLDVYEVERIEVLRGPQGTLYGRNTIGGAIKYVTKRLSDEPTMKIKGSLGTHNQRDLVISGSMPLSDNVRVGGSVASFQRDGFGENQFTGDEHYDKDIMAYRGSFEWDVTDNFQIRANVDYSDDESSPKGGHRLTAAPGYPILSDVFDTRAGITETGLVRSNDVEQSGGALTMEWQVSEAITLKSVSSYREDRTESPIDFDSLPGNSFDVPVVYDNEQLSQEFQIAFEGDKVRGIAGVYYLEANAFNAFDVILGQFGITSFTLGDVDTETWAAFADVDIDLSDTLTLSLGGRYTEDKRDVEVIRTVYGGLSSPYFSGGDLGVDPFEGSRTDSEFTPRASISWQPDPDLHYYASYSMGFKGGGFDPRGDYSNTEVHEGFDPETVDAYELGIKANLLEGRLITNVALFYSDYTDVQIPGSVAIDNDGDGVDDDFAGTVTNAGEGEISGVELELTAYVTESLRSNLALGYINADFKEWIVDGDDISDGKVFQNTPEWTAAFSLSYSTDMNLGDMGGELNLLGSVSYRSETHQFEDPNELLDQDSYSLVNASVTWTSDDDRWQVGLHGKNLGDKEYKVAGYNFPTLGEGGTVTAFYGNPRTVTGSVTYSF